MKQTLKLVVILAQPQFENVGFKTKKAQII